MLFGLAVAGLAASSAHPQEVDNGVIRLAPPQPPEQQQQPETPVATDTAEFSLGEARRGFDYEAFQARLEALWFQRKAFLAAGREDDAARQTGLIRSFCAQEGVRRLDGLAGALLAEAERYRQEGHYSKALSTLELAETFDRGRAQTSFAKATIYAQSGRGYLRAAGELIRALKRSVASAMSNLTLFNQFAVVLVISVMGCVAVFSVLMLFHYQVALRHEVEEWLTRRSLQHWSASAGWGVLLFPFLIWFGAGWAAVYWIVVTFRFMRRPERVAAAGLLIATVLAAPAYRVAVALYGVTADPVVRTTLASAGGAYDPDRIVKLRQLVDTYPRDPIYRFLLAGQYANGRYFEEAYGEYRRVLDLDPSLYQAHINIGNIFHVTGQHGQAVASYRRSLELRPDAVLALYNMYLTQSKSFRFKEAEKSLNRARALNEKQVNKLMTASREQEDSLAVVDESVNLGSIWQAALEGRQLQRRMEVESGGGFGSFFRQFVNPVSLMALLALLACGAVLVLSGRQMPAQRCIRCGRPFCHYCKSGRHVQAYCSQCLHLFVLGDGLAPETKTRKMYEVERHERWSRKTRRLVSLLLPGTAQLLRGRAALGCLLLLLWLAALLAWRPSTLAPLEQLAGLDLQLELLDAGAVPALFRVNPTAVLAVTAAIVVWLAGNFWRWRGQEA